MSPARVLCIAVPFCLAVLIGVDSLWVALTPAECVLFCH